MCRGLSGNPGENPKEICHIWRSQPTWIVPTRRCWIVQVITPCHIVKWAHTIIRACLQVEQAWRISKLALLTYHAFIDQSCTYRPDWCRCARSAHSPPLPIEVDCQGICHR